MKSAHNSSRNRTEPQGTRRVFGLSLALVVCASGMAMSCAESSGASNRTQEPPNDTCGDRPGEMTCNDRCVDTGSSGAHCGGCAGQGGEVCSGNTVCSEGRCQANCTLATQTRCGNSCSDLENDRQNCGACDFKCGAGLNCIGGVCACPEPLVMCGTECVDVNTNKNHCGGCFNSVSSCDLTSSIDPCEDVQSKCSGELCYCDDPLCSNRAECKTSSLYSNACPLPAPSDRCVPECVHMAAYRAYCNRFNGTSTSSGLGAGASGGGTGGGGPTSGIRVPPAVANAIDIIGEAVNTPAAAGEDPEALPVADECAATRSLDDNTCDLVSCTKILTNGLLTVDPNVEIVGSLSRPGDQADCFMFGGKDDVQGFNEVIGGESIQINFGHIPVGHEYEAKLYFIKEYAVSDAMAGPSECSANQYVEERALEQTSATSWTYSPGLGAGDATGQYFVLISRKLGVGSDCGGEYRLLINGLR